MPEQCPCSQLDWTGCDMRAEHHPDCGRNNLAMYGESEIKEGVTFFDSRTGKESEPSPIYNFGWRRNLAQQQIIGQMSELVLFDDSGLKEELKNYKLQPGEIIFASTEPQVPRTIDELIAAMESMMGVGEPGLGSHAVTGEEFIMLTSGGVKGEGEPIGVYCTYKEKAIELFWREFDLHYTDVLERADGACNLYWRQKPTVRERILYAYDHDRYFDADERGPTLAITLYTVVARLLVSDKPPLVK